MNIPLTQSEKWKTLQDDLGKLSYLKSTDAYHYLAIEEQTPLGNYLYLPYGPIAKDEKSFKKALESLTSLAKEKASVFIRIEPRTPEMAQYLPHTAKKVKDLNPKETWVLDLSGEDLKKKLPSRLVRYHKNAAKTGLKIEKTKDPEKIRELLTLQKALAKEKNISTFSENYLKTELNQPFSTLYLVKHTENNREETVAAGLVFDDETTRYNLQGAQSDKGRSLHATGILTIELILDAKKKGLKTFDFWGIAPEGAGKDHPWSGFTAFKKTFKGREVDYAGTYDLPVNPAKYRLYTIMRSLNRAFRRI